MIFRRIACSFSISNSGTLVAERREREKLDQIAEYVGQRGGEVLDRYVGPSITMLRLRAVGQVIRTLLTIFKRSPRLTFHRYRTWKHPTHFK